jgi:antitoxin (DNA-binding transcriptional repressor) of toxin-antitoxin stability system
MTGASSAAGPDAGPERRWDVALSFAGAQRDYVEQVAEALQARRVRCFYDADEQIDLWGKYLAEELPVIYGEQAAAVVVFVSAEYAARDWTRLERRAALNRAVRERREYVLPARFDDTPLPGLLSDMVAVDLRTRTPQQFAAMIADKLARQLQRELDELRRQLAEAQHRAEVAQAQADKAAAELRAIVRAEGDEAPVYTLRDLNQQTARIMSEIEKSGMPTCITSNGRFVAIITSLAPGQVEAPALAEIAREIARREGS